MAGDSCETISSNNICLFACLFHSQNYPQIGTDNSETKMIHWQYYCHIVIIDYLPMLTYVNQLKINPRWNKWLNHLFNSTDKFLILYITILVPDLCLSWHRFTFSYNYITNLWLLKKLNKTHTAGHIALKDKREACHVPIHRLLTTVVMTEPLMLLGQ